MILAIHEPAMNLVELDYSPVSKFRFFSLASSSYMNQLVFKHSSRKLPLKDSIAGLSVDPAGIYWLAGWPYAPTCCGGV